MKPNIEDTKRPANGAIYVQSNTHLFALADSARSMKDEPQKLDIQLKK